MRRQTVHETMVVRTRRIMIFTFIIVFALLFWSAHTELQLKEQEDALALTESEETQTSLNTTEESEQESLPEEDPLIIREEDMWSLILTNAAYPVPENFEIVLKKLPSGGQSVDERIYEPLVRMMEDMKAAGLSPVICSGYRNLDRQEKLFNKKVQTYVRRGYTWEAAYNEARHTLSIPGSGEHCLGLAVDFFTKTYRKLEVGFEQTPESAWLREHAQDYGFILRYEQGKEDITGISYEPWHYRYVGVDAAHYIKKHHMTMEEFYIDQSLYK